MGNFVANYGGKIAKGAIAVVASLGAVGAFMVVTSKVEEAVQDHRAKKYGIVKVKNEKEED